MRQKSNQPRAALQPRVVSLSCEGPVPGLCWCFLVAGALYPAPAGGVLLAQSVCDSEGIPFNVSRDCQGRVNASHGKLYPSNSTRLLELY